MFDSLKSWTMIGIIMGVIALSWRYTSMAVDYENAKSMTEKQNSVIADQKEVIMNLKNSQEIRDKIQSKVSKSFQTIEERAKDIDKQLEKKKNGDDRSLSEIATRHPIMFNDIINKATADYFRCLELISGAIPTEKDTLNVNQQCPNLTKKYTTGD
jgi:hypothetical protein